MEYDLVAHDDEQGRTDLNPSLTCTISLPQPSSGIEHLVETHRTTLFTLSEYESAFLASNLTFEFDEHGPTGRGALIGQPMK